MHGGVGKNEIGGTFHVILLRIIARIGRVNIQRVSCIIIFTEIITINRIAGERNISIITTIITGIVENDHHRFYLHLHPLHHLHHLRRIEK